MDKQLKFDALLQCWIEQKKIPGAVLDVTVGRSFRFQKAYGQYEYGNTDEVNTQVMALDTLFDLASLTKVVATLPAILHLISTGQLGLDDPVSRFYPHFNHRNITIRHLLTHTSGLPAGLGLPTLNKIQSVQDAVKEISDKALLTPPGEAALYSDVGLILTGAIIEKVSGIALDEYVKHYVFEPLSMNDTCYRPYDYDFNRVAATEWKDGAYVHRRVHDGTSQHLGEVCGHAGLFGTASDLQRYAMGWLYPGESLPWLNEERVRDSLIKRVFGRGLGWQVYEGRAITAGSPRLSCGTNWSIGSFGHTGFTGTSLWIDPQKELIVVLLTNVVQLGRDHQLPKLRPELHEMIAASIDDQ